jgi:beta-lactamase class D
MNGVTNQISRRTVLLLTPSLAIAKPAPVRQRPEWKTHFDSAGYEGSILIHDRADSTWHVHNLERSKTGFLPCSTFKIPNSLIALETGVAPDEKLMIPWNGVKRDFEIWNKDMDMEEAIRLSCVPYYQEIARRIGRERMQRFVNRIDYGNRDLSGPLDQFWLTGNLRINQWEQIRLLERLYDGKLPFSRRNMEIVRRILPREDGPGGVIHAKTGLGYNLAVSVGWWVGWFERPAGACFFALNIAGKRGDNGMGPARKVIALKILSEFGASN